MCIAFDGAYILEAPTATTGPADDGRSADDRSPAPEVAAEPDREMEPEPAPPATTGEQLAKVGA